MAEALRRDLIETAIEMNRCGLNRGTSGNLSVRHGDGFLITPSGMPYSELQAADLVFVSDDGRFEGEYRPSSEWRIHRDVYRAREDAGAILHAHPVHCTALACLRKPVPAFHYMVAVAGGKEIPLAGYATFGGQALSDNVLAALGSLDACLMANHGLICLASEMQRALALAVEVEQLAHSYLLCLAAGEPSLLDDDEMERVLTRFRDYGNRGRGEGRG